MKLDSLHPIDRTLLSESDYFSSLLTQAYAKNLLLSEDIERIQKESLSLLAVKIKKLTFGESSSIKIEKAQELLTSVFYTLGIALKAYASPEDAVTALKQLPIENIYEIGRTKIRHKIHTAKLIHKRIKSKLFKTSNVFYASTVIDGINGFFKLYRPDFLAHETHITADYPTFIKTGGYSGIEFIEHYLHNIDCENRFCLYFSSDRTEHLLYGLGKDHSQILTNIYGHVLTAALCCVITQRPIYDLCCNTDLLNNKLKNKTKDEVIGILTDAANVVISELNCTENIAEYVMQSIPEIAAELQYAIRLGTLNTAVLTPKHSDDTPQFTLSYGEKMSSREYTELTEKLLQTDDINKKSDIILSEIHSFGDLSDILHDAMLNNDELLNIFRRLSPEVLAVLMAAYPNCDFFNDEQEYKIYSAIQTHLSELPAQAKEALENAAQSVALE